MKYLDTVRPYESSSSSEYWNIKRLDYIAPLPPDEITFTEKWAL